MPNYLPKTYVILILVLVLCSPLMFIVYREGKHNEFIYTPVGKITSMLSPKSPHIVTYNQTYIAMIMEGRSASVVPQFPGVIKNIIDNIPADWRIQVFYADSNLQLLQESALLASHIKSGKVFLDNYIANVTIPDGGVYSALLKTVAFWDQVKGEKILLFQTDSVICSNSTLKTDYWMKYDYIGAPWHHSLGHAQYTNGVGNGGFSVRTKSVMKEIITKFGEGNDYQNEDVFFSRGTKDTNHLLAPLEEAVKFAVETEYYATPFAVHKPWNYQTQWFSVEQYAKLQEWCSEIVTVFGNKIGVRH